MQRLTDYLIEHKRLGSVMLFICVLLIGTKSWANTVLLQDNFNAENQGKGALNYTAFANFNVTQGTVDIAGNAYNDIYPGHLMSGHIS